MLVKEMIMCELCQPDLMMFYTLEPRHHFRLGITGKSCIISALIVTMTLQGVLSLIYSSIIIHYVISLILFLKENPSYDTLHLGCAFILYRDYSRVPCHIPNGIFIGP